MNEPLLRAALRRAPFLDPDELDADGRGHRAAGGQHQGKQSQAELDDVGGFGGQAQDHATQDGGHEGLVQVGAHAGHVADIVAHVIGDGGGIAGVVFGDARFHLAHQVRAHVGGLGVDAAAHAREQGYARGAQGEARKDGQDLVLEVGRVPAEEMDVHVDDAGDAAKGQAHHAHAHHGSAREGHLERLVEAHCRGLGGAHVGLGGDLHAEESRQCRTDGAEGEGDGFPAEHALVPQEQQGGSADHERNQHLVFPEQERHGSLGHVSADFLELLVLDGKAEHPPGFVEREDQGEYASQHSDRQGQFYIEIENHFAFPVNNLFSQLILLI